MKLRLSFSYVEVGGWWCGRFAGVLRRACGADMTESNRRGDRRRGHPGESGWRGWTRRRLLGGVQSARDVYRGGRVAEALAAHRHKSRAGVQQLASVNG